MHESGPALREADASQALARNVYPDTADEPSAVALAQYVRRVDEVLGTQPLAALSDGIISFPDPGFRRAVTE